MIDFHCLWSAACRSMVMQTLLLCQWSWSLLKLKKPLLLEMIRSWWYFCIIMQALFTIGSTFIQGQRQDDSRGTWILQRAKAKLREQVCQHLLFVHTILGCDTTSRLFGFRKVILLKLIQTSQTSIEQGSNIQPRGVVISRKRQLCAYTRQVCALNNLKNLMFSDLIQTSRKAIQPKQLPPMWAATKFSSFHVFHQISTWKNRKPDPENLGCKL